MTSIFLSYARGDNVDPFNPVSSFVSHQHRDLTARGFEVWFDRIAMPSRGLTFHQETQDAAAACQRLVLFVRPKAAVSDDDPAMLAAAHDELHDVVLELVESSGQNG